MNHLTTLYVNQADRERQIADGLRNRQVQHVEPNAIETTRRATTTDRPPTTTHPRPTALRARTAGR